jgi:hypothetical protein
MNSQVIRANTKENLKMANPTASEECSTDWEDLAMRALGWTESEMDTVECSTMMVLTIRDIGKQEIPVAKDHLLVTIISLNIMVNGTLGLSLIQNRWLLKSTKPLWTNGWHTTIFKSQRHPRSKQNKLQELPPKRQLPFNTSRHG